MSVASLSGFTPRRRYDSKRWTGARIEGAPGYDGPWTEVETFTWGDSTFDSDPTEPVARSFTTELVDPSMSFLRVVWVDDDGDQDATDPLALSTSGTFTTIDAVATRLGRDLSDAETAQATLFIQSATTGIIAALGRNPLTWTPPPQAKQLVSMMCLELVARTMANPDALVRKGETVGSYSYQEIYAQRGVETPGLLPNETEELFLRRTVWGSNVASVRTPGMADDYADITWPYLYWHLWWGVQDDQGSWITWI